MKMVGITPQKIEIEPGTTVNFWAPTHKKNNINGESRTPVVLLHGFFSDGILTWIFQVLALSVGGKYDVYVPDFIFFGDSSTDKPDRSVSFQAECVAAEGLRKLGVQRCTVVGFSYGGFVGFKLAKLYPELVHSMVTSGSTFLELDEIVKNTRNLLLQESIQKLKLLISIGSHKKLFSSFPNFVYRDFLEVMYSHRKERAELLEALIDDEFYPPKFPQKHHLLWGEKDKIINLDTAYHMKVELGEEVRLEYIADAGHVVHLERPILYSQHLNRILASFHHSNGAIGDAI